jgi:dTDP-glucose pyrophosphorylase
MKPIKPCLVIMAAGLGSRYGGLKQIDPIGPNGEILIEFAIQDMIHFGGEKIVCIISESIRHDFETLIVAKYQTQIQIELVVQSLDKMVGSRNPERVKPWGT